MEVNESVEIPNQQPSGNSIQQGIRSPVEAMLKYIESLPEEVSIRDEVKCFQFWKAVRTEFLATFLLIIFTCGSVGVYPFSLPPPSNRTNFTSNSSVLDDQLILFELKVSLIFGLTVATLIQCMGQVSGCHMNPAITLSLLITRRLTVFRFGMYLLSQCLGSAVASGILSVLLKTSDNSGGFQEQSIGFLHPNNSINASQAFGYEFLATFIVVMAHLANTDPQKSDTGFKALSIGLAYTVGHLFAFRHTGAGLNPVRAFGPAIVQKAWDYQWIYWVGPSVAGLLSGFTYEYIRSSSSSDSQTLKSSFRRRRQATGRTVKRDATSGLSNNETEFTITSAEIPRY